MLLRLLTHIFEHAEVYTLGLVAAVIPLTTCALYLFLQRRYFPTVGLHLVTQPKKVGR